jgi:protein-disulfide isomerase
MANLTEAASRRSAVHGTRAGVWAAWIVVTLAACQPPPSKAPEQTTLPSDAERAQIDQRVQDYFKKTANMPPGMTLKVVQLEPAPIAGMLSGSIEVTNGSNSQKVPLMLSRDGRYLIQGQLTDLTVDPFKATMDKISLKDQPLRGNPTAAVTIVEFSDFQCPFCSRAYKTLEEQVLKDYGDKVRLVFKNFPLSNIHPWADAAALASACVKQQKPDAFWKFYDYFFQHQSEVAVDSVKEKAEGVVRDAGLDVGAFDNCFDNKSALDAVKADQAEATAVGVRSTPTFFINGRKLEGAVPYENFKTALDQTLNPEKAAAAATPGTTAPTPGVVHPG